MATYAEAKRRRQALEQRLATYDLSLLLIGIFFLCFMSYRNLDTLYIYFSASASLGTSDAFKKERPPFGQANRQSPPPEDKKPLQSGRASPARAERANPILSFESMDANGDGVIDRDEYIKAQQVENLKFNTLLLLLSSSTTLKDPTLKIT